MATTAENTCTHRYTQTGRLTRVRTHTITHTHTHTNLATTTLAHDVMVEFVRAAPPRGP